jgi:hypothetical protein
MIGLSLRRYAARRKPARALRHRSRTDPGNLPCNAKEAGAGEGSALRPSPEPSLMARKGVE